ncbi:ATP-binding protein [candidate division NPL-UPA2 bacterium]|nr:ATP-binding protein [candidate division NPL-UPA2 bacterium]
MKRIQSLYLFDPEVSARKMIFLFGPRQVGKTTFVKNRLREIKNEELYFDWDDPYVRREYTKNPHFLKAYLARIRNKFPLVAFDEIHKHKNWKNILKGLCDLHSEEAQFIVTGSARLDYFRRSGDSLVGRYFSYRLLPLGLAEAAGNFDFILKDDVILAQPDKQDFLRTIQQMKEKAFKGPFERLMTYGGFPEPFLKAKKSFSNKWKRDYKSLLIHEDLRDLTRIQDIKGIEQLLLLLSERIASPLSINSLRDDLQVNHKTVSSWLEALKKIYLTFSITPWSKRIARAIKKEAKFYFFDWTMVSDEGARFENAIAVLLLRLVCRWNELGLGDFELRYIRNQQGQEVDFVVIKDQRPFALFEAKKSDIHIPNSGAYFNKLLKIPYYQMVSDYDIVEAYPDNRYVVSAWRLLALLG